MLSTSMPLPRSCPVHGADQIEPYTHMPAVRPDVEKLGKVLLPVDSQKCQFWSEKECIRLGHVRPLGKVQERSEQDRVKN